MSFSFSLLNIAFDQQIPYSLERIIRPDICDLWLHDFKLVVVLSMQGDTLFPTRITWSAQGEEEYWRESVIPLLHVDHQNILAHTAIQIRSVIDTDGTEHRLFLDDLHKEVGGDIMTRIYGPLENDTEFVRIRKSPLSPMPPSTLLFHPLYMGAMALGGMWAERISDATKQSKSILWISEARWKKNTPQAKELLDRHCGHPIWRKLQEFMQDKGIAYPDVVEFYMDGRIEFSVAFLPTAYL